MTSPSHSLKNSWLRYACAALLTALSAIVATAQCANPGFNIGKHIHTNLPSLSFPAAALDFNGDGKADLAMRTGISFGSSANKISIALGDGTGGLSAPSEISVGPNLSSIVFGDVNQDNRPDIITNHFEAANSKLWLNNGAGAFASSQTLVNSFGKPLLVVDVNGDGKGDIVSGNDNSFTVRLGNGAGVFSEGTPIFFAPNGSTGIYGLMPGDFNNDMTIDLAVSYIRSTGESKLVIYGGDGSGGFVAFPEIVLTGDNVALTLSGDFNNDGKLDLAGENSLAPTAPDAVSVLLNNGMGGFAQADYPVVAGLLLLRKGDFNGDGKLDLATETRTTAEFWGAGYGTMLYGNGTGGFTRRDQYKSRVKIDVVADFNNDGSTDALSWGFATELAPYMLRTMLGTCARRNQPHIMDYDGDGITDYALWRPSEGRWYIRYSSGGLRLQFWGVPTDIPVPGDYDGDDKTDMAVFRPSDGNWYIIKSSDNNTLSMAWGANGDKPVQGDYDGDGKTDLAVFRPSNGSWYILKSSDSTLLARQFGISTDKPVQADFDGDYKTDIAVYRPSDGAWYILKSSDDSLKSAMFGLSADKPVQGDYDGDGVADIAVYRPADGVWYVLRSLDNSVRSIFWGLSPDRPVPGDFEKRDGIINITVRRDSNSSFYTFNDSNPIVWGASGDVPVSIPYRIE